MVGWLRQPTIHQNLFFRRKRRDSGRGSNKASDFEKTLTFYISYIAPRPLLRDNDSTNNREV